MRSLEARVRALERWRAGRRYDIASLADWFRAASWLERGELTEAEYDALTWQPSLRAFVDGLTAKWEAESVKVSGASASS